MTAQQSNGGHHQPLLKRWGLGYRDSHRWESAGGSAFEPVPSLEDGSSFPARMIAVSFADFSAETFESASAILIGMDGEIEIEAFSRRFRIARHDFLILQAGSCFRYRNIGLAQGRMLAIYSDVAGSSEPAMATPSSAEPLSNALHIEWSTYRRRINWALPQGDKWGYHRGAFPPMQASAWLGQVLMQPTCQGTPWHSAPRTQLYVLLEGQLEFSTSGNYWPMERRDLLLMPADVPYKYTNVGRESAIFFCVGRRLGVGQSATYYDSPPQTHFKK